MIIEVKELIGYPGYSDSSSDSDSDDEKSAAQNNPYKKAGQAKGVDGTTAEFTKSINEKVFKKELVNVDSYHRYFVAHFRGIHFFKDIFDQVQRRASREKIRSKSIEKDINSPAVHELCKVHFGEEINKKEKQKAQNQIYNELLWLKSIVPSLPFWVRSNDRVHDNLLYQHYHRYVNNYESFKLESSQKYRECYSYLTCTTNPYVSTTEKAVHAVYYALGGKTTKAQSALRPYDNELRAKHPKVGYVQVILHSIEDLKAQQPLFLSSLHGSKYIDINHRYLSERETTFLSFIPASNVIDSFVVRFPSFKGNYKDYYIKKYGISKRSYNAFKKALFSNCENTTLLETIAQYYAESLMTAVETAVKEKGGYLVHILLDGAINSTPFSNFEISDLRKSNLVFDVYSKLNSFYSSKQLEELLTKAFLPYGNENKKITIPYGFSDVPSFYHAICCQLNNGCTAQDLQKMSIGHIINNPDNYMKFLTGLIIPGLNELEPLKAIEAYIKNKLKCDYSGNNAWADILMIQAAANALGLKIYTRMFNVDGTPQKHQGNEVTLQFIPVQEAAADALIVGNIANLHFVTPIFVPNQEDLPLTGILSLLSISE